MRNAFVLCLLAFVAVTAQADEPEILFLEPSLFEETAADVPEYQSEPVNVSDGWEPVKVSDADKVKPEKPENKAEKVKVVPPALIPKGGEDKVVEAAPDDAVPAFWRGGPLRREIARKARRIRTLFGR